MRRVPRLVTVAALIGFLLSGCGRAEMSCSCAAGTTYEGSFYQQYANTSVRAEAPLGSSDEGEGCCGEAEPRVTVYSITGIDPEIAIATKDDDGTAHFNVASDLTRQKQEVADRFAEKHHQSDQR